MQNTADSNGQSVIDSLLANNAFLNLDPVGNAAKFTFNFVEGKESFTLGKNDELGISPWTTIQMSKDSLYWTQSHDQA